MANEFMGWQKHLHLRPETTWGVHSSSNTSLMIPYARYSVQTKVVATQADLFVGLRQRRHHRVQRASVEGVLSVPLWAQHVDGKSIAQHLLEWGASGPQSPFLDSMTADIFESDTDNKRHLGLRVRSMTLAGDATSSGITLEMELDGKEEQGGITPPPLSPTPAPLAEFLFSDAELFLSTGAEAEGALASEKVDVRSFRLRLENNLRTYHTSSYFPSLVVAGIRAVSFQFTIFKNSNLLDLMRRTSDVSRRACRLVLKGRHLGTAGTGTFTTVTILLDQAHFADATDSVRLNELVEQSADWVVIKPATAEPDIELAFGLAS
jgi:hypothetical protein